MAWIQFRTPELTNMQVMLEHWEILFVAIVVSLVLLIVADRIEHRSVDGMGEGDSLPGRIFTEVEPISDSVEAISFGWEARSLGDRLTLVWFHIKLASRCLLHGNFGLTVLREKRDQ